MRITRYPNINETQFFGCVSAFVDSLSGELNAATMAIRRLSGRGKGAAFAFEMSLDTHRYGALIVIDRWSTFTAAFGPHLELSRHPEILTRAVERVRAAEEILGRANMLVDGAADYSEAVVEACVMAFQAVDGIFAEERAEAEQSGKLGPMLAEDYRDYRRIFLEDLAAR
ncbi:MAG: hypothetical protein ABI759_31050 [Candidatus Solibacter sp.]